MEPIEDPRKIRLLIDEILAADNLAGSSMCPSRGIDPWHTQSALDTDHVILIEFCEQDGPRPAWCIPRVADPPKSAKSPSSAIGAIDPHLPSATPRPYDPSRQTPSSNSSTVRSGHLETVALDDNHPSDCYWSLTDCMKRGLGSGNAKRGIPADSAGDSSSPNTPLMSHEGRRTAQDPGEGLPPTGSTHQRQTPDGSPTLTTSSRLSPHFDRNEFAVWLMTADYQATNQRSLRSNFGGGASDNDVAVMLSNEEQGLHALAYHYTLYDIDARGFLRPYCLSYVTNDAHKLTSLFTKIRRKFHAILKPVKLCNKLKFCRELTEAIGLLETMQSSTVSSYYELYYHAESTSNSENEQKQQNRQKQAEAKSLLHELMDVDENSSLAAPGSEASAAPLDTPKSHKETKSRTTSSSSSEKQFDSKCRRLHRELWRIKILIDQNLRQNATTDDNLFDASDDGSTSSHGRQRLRRKCRQDIGAHGRPDVSAWVRKLCAQSMSPPFNRPDDPHAVTAGGITTKKIDESSKEPRYLCPCVYDPFLDDLVDLWRCFRCWDEFYDEMTNGGGGMTSKVKLYVGKTPVLFLPSLTKSDSSTSEASQNIDPSTYDEPTTADVTNFCAPENPGDATLLKIGPNLKFLLYPLLSGQFMLVHGSEFRRAKIERFVKKLSQFIPHVAHSDLKPCESGPPYPSVVKRGSTVDPAILADHKIYGLERETQSASLNPFFDVSWQSTPTTSLRQFIANFDTDTDTLEAADYGNDKNCGILHYMLDKNVLARYTCDGPFVQYAKCMVKRLAGIAYVLYFHIYGIDDDWSPFFNNMPTRNYSTPNENNTKTIRKNFNATADTVVRMHKFADRFKLTTGDMNIVKYLVELLKNAQNSINRPKMGENGQKIVSVEDRLASLVLQPGPNAVFKLKTSGEGS